MTLESIKRSKKLIKRLKNSIYIKKPNLMAKVDFFRSLMDLFQSNSNFSIKFHCDDLKSGVKFGIKKLIKSRFGDLVQLHGPS